MTNRLMRCFLIQLATAGLCLLSISGAFAAEQNRAPVSATSYNGTSVQQTLRSRPETGPMSVAQLGSPRDRREPARGDECPVGSGAYCSDESPYCFMCRGEYACCWSSQVWRCCQ
jgi:hypothetical protein